MRNIQLNANPVYFVLSGFTLLALGIGMFFMTHGKISSALDDRERADIETIRLIDDIRTSEQAMSPEETATVLEDLAAAEKTSRDLLRAQETVCEITWLAVCLIGFGQLWYGWIGSRLDRRPDR